MPSEQTTEQRINAIIVEHLGVDSSQVTPDANIYDDLGADSLDAVELEMALEDEFGIRIPDNAGVSDTDGSLSAITALVEKVLN